MFGRLIAKKKENPNAPLSDEDKRVQALVRQGANVSKKIKVFTEKYNNPWDAHFLGVK